MTTSIFEKKAIYFVFLSFYLLYIYIEKKVQNIDKLYLHLICNKCYMRHLIVFFLLCTGLKPPNIFLHVFCQTEKNI